VSDRTQITIHRSATEIGGNCIEIRHGSDRLIIDAGLPLDALELDPAALIPKTLSLSEPATVLISHSHQDHAGAIPALPNDWPVWCGAASKELILLTARNGRWKGDRTLHTWTPGIPFSVQGYQITPHLTDHSAFDAAMLEIDAGDGGRFLYTGDFRRHGRKSGLVDGFMSRPPGNIDVLFMEGTTLGREGVALSESALESRFTELFRNTRGRVFVAWAGTNVDRTVTLARACLRTGRSLVVDMWTAEVLSRLLPYSPRLPHVGQNPMQVVITSRLKRWYKSLGAGAVVDAMADTNDSLSSRRLATVSNAVVMVRDSLIADFERGGVLPGPDDVWCWSQWSGYLDKPQGQKISEWFSTRQCPACHLHTSGHARPSDLRAFARAIAPRWLVPIHGESWDTPSIGWPPICRLRNGETWEWTGGRRLDLLPRSPAISALSPG
jgi:ribonuclease J